MIYDDGLAEESIREHFTALTSKIKRSFYKIEFHVKFANSFGFLPIERRSLQGLREVFGLYIGNYNDFYNLMDRLATCGIIEKAQPIKSIGFHKGMNWEEYKKIVNETNKRYCEWVKKKHEEKIDELSKDDLMGRNK